MMLHAVLDPSHRHPESSMSHPSRLRSSAPAAALAAALITGACAPAVADPEPAGGVDAQRAFFENMRGMCGQTFGGRTVYAEAHDRTFEPARLFFVVEECDEEELRIPFIVGDDDSRTWILRMGEEGLTFSHEHLRPDGAPHDVSGFGGHATTDGSATFQSFPDFWATEETRQRNGVCGGSGSTGSTISSSITWTGAGSRPTGWSSTWVRPRRR
jgi:hypothetical protein